MISHWDVQVDSCRVYFPLSVSTSYTTNPFSRQLSDGALSIVSCTQLPSYICSGTDRLKHPACKTNAAVHTTVDPQSATQQQVTDRCFSWISALIISCNHLCCDRFGTQFGPQITPVITWVFHTRTVCWTAQGRRLCAPSQPWQIDIFWWSSLSSWMTPHSCYPW